MRYFIFTILLVVPLLLTAQSKKEQIATLNLRVDSLSEVLVNVRVNNAQTLSDKSEKIFQLSQENVALGNERDSMMYILKEQIATLKLRVDSLSDVLVNERINNEQTLSDSSEIIFQLSQEKGSLEKDNEILKSNISLLENEISTLNNALNSPYLLSSGMIDYRLFDFLSSSDFHTDGNRDFVEMMKINKIALDTITLDGDTVYDFFYFNEGKVLILEKYLEGDFEEDPVNEYYFYLYNHDNKKFEYQFSLPYQSYSYNYTSGYILVQYKLRKWDEYSYSIINNKLEHVGWFEDYDDEFSLDWNEGVNEILIKKHSGEFYGKLYENTNNEFVLGLKAND